MRSKYTKKQRRKIYQEALETSIFQSKVYLFLESKSCFMPGDGYKDFPEVNLFYLPPSEAQIISEYENKILTQQALMFCIEMTK